MNPHKRTYIHDAIHGTFDISQILPLVETREFQALSEKRQLGMTYLVFPNARHTRLEHSLGAFQGTKILTDRLVALGCITAQQQTELCVYAGGHDLGHPAFSHVTEDFCARDDDEQTLELVNYRVRPAIEACGVSSAAICSLIDHSNPLYRIVHDRNIGTEKLDYLERDGKSVGFQQPTALGAVRNHVLYVDGHMAIDEKIVDHVEDILTFYMKMYKEVYFRKALVIAQRMFQKAVYQLIRTGALVADELYDMTDPELLGRMASSLDPMVAMLYADIRERRLFKEAVVIRSEQFVCETRLAGKPIGVCGIDPDLMRQLVNSPSLQKGSHAALEELEAQIERVTGMPVGSVLVVPVFNPERFKSQDVMIFGSDGNLHSLQERRPAHFEKMKETARTYSALRVCTRPEHREALSRAADDVLRVVLTTFA